MAESMPRSAQVPQQCPQAPLAPALAIPAPLGDQQCRRLCVQVVSEEGGDWRGEAGLRQGNSLRSSDGACKHLKS